MTGNPGEIGEISEMDMAGAVILPTREELEAQLEHKPQAFPMLPIHYASRLLFHGKTYFERGAKEQIQEDLENGISYEIIQMHPDRLSPLHIAQITQKNKVLRPLRLKTGITARSEVFDWPWPAKAVLPRSGAQKVVLDHEAPDATPEEHEQHKIANLKTQYAAAPYYRAGLHWLIYAEGGSRDTVVIDGVEQRVPRPAGVLGEFKKGLAYSLDPLTPEERERVKFLGIAMFNGPRRFSKMRPTNYIPMPEAPIQGTHEEITQQAEDMLRRALVRAMYIDQHVR